MIDAIKAETSASKRGVLAVQGEAPGLGSGLGGGAIFAGEQTRSRQGADKEQMTGRWAANVSR